MTVFDWITGDRYQGTIGVYFGGGPVPSDVKLVHITPRMEHWAVVKLFRKIEQTSPFKVILIRK